MVMTINVLLLMIIMVMVNNVGNSIYNDYNEAVYDKGEYDNGNGESIDHKKCYCY